MDEGRKTWTRFLATAVTAAALMMGGSVGLQTAAAAKATGAAAGLPKNQLPLSFLKGIHRLHTHFMPPSLRNGQGHARFGITSIDSIPNFNGHFILPGYDPAGNPNKLWYTNTVGNPPQLGGTTSIRAPIIPVSLELMNVDGNGTNLLCDSSSSGLQALNSPVFSNAAYSSSSKPTQFTDAIQRAEYFGKAKSDWHTMLAPKLEANRVLQIPPGSYSYIANPDGSCLVPLVNFDLVANLIFPATATDTSTIVGAAEHSGDMTTKDITSLLLQNALLYFGDPNNCCVLGFHTYDLEPGDAGNGNLQKNYVLNISTWLDPALFGAILGDVSTLTHEMSETFNDPFVTSDNVHNVTPWWLDPTGTLCQNNLETGDVIEFMPNQIFTMTMNGMTYHTQTEALLQWFEGLTPSDAIGGAYSYPDTTVLTSPLVSMKANCVP